MERAVVLRLKEVEVGETQRLLMKIDKLERLNRLLEEKLETKINRLEENAKRGEDKER